MPVKLSGIFKRQSEIKILEALKEGSKTWSQLVIETGLSKRTLQLRLPKMEERGVIKRELVAEPGQRSRVLYVLSEKGSQEMPFLVSDMFEGIIQAFKTTVRSLTPTLGVSIIQYLSKDYENCIEFALIQQKQISNEHQLKEHIRAALSYLLFQYVDKPEDLEEITETDFNLTFRFDRSAVAKILQEKEARKTGEPM
jgi:DNA-binding HxlR family transcriptional regulator